jgi:hypothetical protein
MQTSRHQREIRSPISPTITKNESAELGERKHITAASDAAEKSDHEVILAQTDIHLAAFKTNQEMTMVRPGKWRNDC